ncbi:hypothetical protein HYFRA_00001805 [Hymenoscyphus fraxineus]|uniref:Uncharacterized protein n=1 Tax=Hymenoscyphus fraxineus TaxID=746836 RepID=A0A9N9KJG0_9HELO|nr:hypothetical protein HYFRA_00001805 [Hymenoscyphus fraxineus]
MLLPNVLAVVAVASTLVAGVPVQSGEHLVARAAPPPRTANAVDKIIAFLTPKNSPAVFVQHGGRTQKLPGPPPQARPAADAKKPELMPLPQIIRGPFRKREPGLVPGYNRPPFTKVAGQKWWGGGIKASFNRMGAGFKKLGGQAKAGYNTAKETARRPKAPKGAATVPKGATTVDTPTGPAVIFRA